MSSFDRTLPRINTCLLAAIIGINAYLLLAPLYPRLAFLIGSHTARQQLLEHVVQAPVVTARPGTPGPKENRLVVPSMLLDEPIYEGPIWRQYTILNNGIWRYARGSTPDKGGNTVLVGHRFTYTNPSGVFYHLDEVKISDSIGLWWQGHEYRYRVASTSVVPPTDVDVEAPANDSRLTLFTCTPLWVPSNRLVIVAELESKS